MKNLLAVLAVAGVLATPASPALAATDAEWRQYGEYVCRTFNKNDPNCNPDSEVKDIRDSGTQLIVKGKEEYELHPGSPPTYFNPPPKPPGIKEFVLAAERTCIPRLESYSAHGYKWLDKTEFMQSKTHGYKWINKWLEKSPFMSFEWGNRSETKLLLEGWQIEYKSSYGTWNRAYYIMSYYPFHGTCEVERLHIMDSWELRQRTQGINQ